MKKLKASILTTALVFFTIGIGIALFLGVKASIEQYKISAKTDFRITMKHDDRGTINAFFLSEKNKTSVIEQLASDDLSFVQENLDKMRSVEGKNLTLNIFGKKFLGDKKSGEKIIADIPLPGGDIGRIEFIL